MMMDMRANKRFEELVAGVLSGAASEAERAEFGELLEADPARVAEYMRQARMHVLLEACAGLREAKQGRRSVKLLDNMRRGASVLASHWRRVAAIAALLVAGLSVWHFSSPSSWVSPVRGISSVSVKIATVRSNQHGQWADGREVVDGTALHAGVWMWQSGLVELVTTSGTVLLVEAPASLEIVDTLHARLLTGKLVVRMPKGCSGFVVDTPEMRVLDLGTEFGVSVSPAGESQVQVYDGKVRAETYGSADRKELIAGETVRSTAGGGLAAESYDENRFIRRFPPVINPERASGVLYSRSEVEAVRVAYAPKAVTTDGDLSEWRTSLAFKGACLPPFAETYHIEGRMMYDAENLYLAAHVGDPEPMCNIAPEGFEFAGGSVIVRVSADKAQGWPLKGSMFVNGAYDFKRERVGAETRNRRIASLILWHDPRSGRARLKLERGIDQHEKLLDPPGWQGVFRKDADGRGYTLEYVIPWRLLNCADDPPRAGDELAALWMVHWSDAAGRIARGQLVEVTNHQPHKGQNIPPYIFFQNGPSWGKAIYLPKGE